MAIISPWWFYLIDVFGGLELLSSTIAICTFFIAPISFCVKHTSSSSASRLLKRHGEGDSDYIESKTLSIVTDKIFKVSSILFVICSLLTVSIPSKETMYTMMVANMVTYENVEVATDVIKDGVDYILQAFEEGEDAE